MGTKTTERPRYSLPERERQARVIAEMERERMREYIIATDPTFLLVGIGA